MIKFKPFKGLRPAKELYPNIVTKPYDVVTYDEIKQDISENKFSFFRIIRSEADFQKQVDPYSDIVYKKAQENLDLFIKNKYLIYDQEENIYIYKQDIKGHSQIGFVGLVSTQNYKDGFVLKHENTREDKEKDRIKHIETLQAQTGSVFLFFKNQQKLKQILDDTQKNTPDIHFKGNDDVTHSIWCVNDSQQKNEICSEFAKTEQLYIADGHHRSAAAEKIAAKQSSEQYQYFMSVICPHDDLLILSYNRVIKDLNNNSPEDFINKIKNNFIVTETNPNDSGGYKPVKKNNIGMYLANTWYLLEPKESILSNDPVKSLDVSLLQDFVLSEVLEISDPKTNKRIDFIGGDKGAGYLKNIVDEGKYSIAFSLFPTGIDELINVADANLLMPPKSTWFEPKLGSGIVVYSYNS